MESWSEKLTQQINSKLEGANDRDLRFFRIEEFKRNLKRVEKFSTSCPECKKEMIDIAEAVSSINEAVNKLGKHRRNYDRLISRISKHMQKEHKFFPPYYFTYLISFAGIVAGSILGYLLMQLNAELKLELFCLGFALGLLPSYIYGHLKDKKIREDKRLM